MNLISLEEHFSLQEIKPNKINILGFWSKSVNLQRIIGQINAKNEGETWCISKHLSRPLCSYGSWHQNRDKKYFKQAYQVYSMFWGIKFGLIDAKNVKKIDKPWSMEDLVSKMVDCCRE